MFFFEKVVEKKPENLLKYEPFIDVLQRLNLLDNNRVLELKKSLVGQGFIKKCWPTWLVDLEDCPTEIV